MQAIEQKKAERINHNVRKLKPEEEEEVCNKVKSALLKEKTSEKIASNSD